MNHQTYRIIAFTGMLLFLCIAFIACERGSPSAPVRPEVFPSVPVGGTQYDITLNVTSNGDGTYNWDWKIVNLKPGNGSNGTQKNLSHWTTTLGQCLPVSAILAAGYGTDGINWTYWPTVPYLNDPPTQSCYAGPTLKFDFGTNGTAPSYYRVVVQGEYLQAENLAVFKYGNFCITASVPGFGCPPEEKHELGTAWGNGPAFPGNNWSMYFTFDPGTEGASKTVDFIMGQFTTCGIVTVTQIAADQYTLTFSLNAGYEMSLAHWHFASSMLGIPHSPGGAVPGQFDYSAPFNPLTSGYTTAPITYTGTFPMYIAAHANIWD